MRAAGATARALLWVAGAAAALWVFGRVWPLVWSLAWPFAAGGALALLVEAPVGWLAARGLPRGLASLLCLVGALGGGALAAAWMAAAAWSELWRLRVHLPAIYAALQRWTQGAQAGGSGLLPPPLRDLLGQEAARGYAAAGPLLQHLLLWLQRAAAAVPETLFALFVSLATAFFLCRDGPALALWLERRLPPRRWLRLRALAAALRQSVWGMVRAQILLALATFAVSLAGLALIGAPYVLVAAAAAALFDFLPVLGPGLVYIPWIVGAAASHLPGAALALAAVLAAVAAARWALTPHLLGRQVGLHPFVALAAMYAGTRLAGVAGLLLGPLAARLLQALWTGAAAPAPPRTPAARP